MPTQQSGEPNAPERDLSPPPARPSWEIAAETRQPTLPSRPSPANRPAAPPPMPAPAWTPAASTPPVFAPPPSAPPPAAYAAPAETVIEYDLAGNPLPQTAAAPAPMPTVPPAAYGHPASYPPPAPFGYSAGNAAPGVWPPPPGGYAPAGFHNNSGQQSHLPPEIERLRWHWGAFFFPILWTKNHGLTTAAAAMGGALLVLRLIRYFLQFLSPLAFFAICGVYAVTYFGVQIYFGLNGHKIGWRNRHFQGGLEEYFKVQNAWMWWGLGINVVSGILLPVLFLGALVAALSTAHSGGVYNNSGAYGRSGYSSPYHSPHHSPEDGSSTEPSGGAGSSAP